MTKWGLSQEYENGLRLENRIQFTHLQIKEENLSH